MAADLEHPITHIPKSLSKITKRPAPTKSTVGCLTANLRDKVEETSPTSQENNRSQTIADHSMLSEKKNRQDSLEKAWIQNSSDERRAHSLAEVTGEARSAWRRGPLDAAQDSAK